jgi:hypothetical protein
MSADTHEALRKQPLSKLGVDLACAVIDHHDGDEAVKVVYGLINLAQVMVKRLAPVDQMLTALTLHQAALDLLPPTPRGKPMTGQNGHWVEMK